MRDITISLPEEVVEYLEEEAARCSTTPSELLKHTILGALPGSENPYWQAYRHWEELVAEPLDLDADHRLSRDEANARP